MQSEFGAHYYHCNCLDNDESILVSVGPRNVSHLYMSVRLYVCVSVFHHYDFKLNSAPARQTPPVSIARSPMWNLCHIICYAISCQLFALSTPAPHSSSADILLNLSGDNATHTQTYTHTNNNQKRVTSMCMHILVERHLIWPYRRRTLAYVINHSTHTYKTRHTHTHTRTCKLT